MSQTLIVFHLDISDNEFNELQSLNIQFMIKTLLVFHLDISGNEFNDLHQLNI